MSEDRPVDADREPERDAWLQSALAHAPDAGLEAPPAVSAAILRAAADRVAPVASAGAWSRLMRVWAALAQPPLAAGLASVLIASVVGVMWWQRPIDEAMPRPAPTLRGESAPAATPAAKPAVEPAAEVAANPAAERADAPPPAAAPAASPATDLAAAEVQAPPHAARRPEAAPPAATAPYAAHREASPPEGLRDQATAQTSEAAVAAAEPAASAGPLGEAVRSKGAAGRSAVAAAPAMAPGSPAMDLLQRWEPAQRGWRWQPPQARDWQPADAAARAWLSRVERATRGRWSPQAEGAAASGATVVVQWQQDEVPQGTLTFEAEGVRWIAPDSRAFFAPLPAATLDALRDY